MASMKNTVQTTPTLLPTDLYHQKLITELALTVMRRWALSDSEQFALTGLKDVYTFQLWQQRIFTDLGQETYLRLVSIININRQLKLLGNTATSAAQWLKTDNPAFQDRSPLHHMLSYGHEGSQDVNRSLHQYTPHPLVNASTH